MTEMEPMTEQENKEHFRSNATIIQQREHLRWLFRGFTSMNPLFWNSKVWMTKHDKDCITIDFDGVVEHV